MSRRITFTDREIWHLKEAIKAVQGQTTLDYQVVKAGRQALQDILDKFTNTEATNAKS